MPDFVSMFEIWVIGMTAPADLMFVLYIKHPRLWTGFRLVFLPLPRLFCVVSSVVFVSAFVFTEIWLAQVRQ